MTRPTLLTVFALTCLTPSAIRGADLVHLWAFDGNTLDTSGSGNHGEAFGNLTYREGVAGQALVLDELDDLVEIDEAANLPVGAEDPWSLNVWYNLNSFPSLAYGGGFGGRLDNGRVRSFLSFGPGGSNEDNAFYFWGSNIDVYAGEDYDTDGRWHMYTITFDGENLRMYEDAQMVIETDVDKQGEFILDEMIGRGEIDPIVSVGGPSNWDQQIDGAVDEFSIWAGALNDDEILSLLALTNAEPGDFNGDGVLDAADIDLLSAQVRGETFEPIYDLTGDELVNDDDRDYWVTELRKTWFGDANLDSEFNSTDFVEVFQSGKFELAEEAGWAEGDWDGDAVFSSSDFVRAFQDGGYELGPPPAARAVPEPATGWLALVAFSLVFHPRRRTATH